MSMHDLVLLGPGRGGRRQHHEGDLHQELQRRHPGHHPAHAVPQQGIHDKPPRKWERFVDFLTSIAGLFCILCERRVVTVATAELPSPEYQNKTSKHSPQYFGLL